MYPSKFKLVATCTILLTVFSSRGDAFNLADLAASVFAGEGSEIDQMESELDMDEPPNSYGRSSWKNYNRKYPKIDDYDPPMEEKSPEFFVTINNVFVFPPNENFDEIPYVKSYENPFANENVFEDEDTQENLQFDYKTCINPENWRRCIKRFTGIEGQKPGEPDAESPSIFQKILDQLKDDKYNFRSRLPPPIPGSNAKSNVTARFSNESARNNQIATDNSSSQEQSNSQNITIGDDKPAALRSSSGSNETLTSQDAKENALQKNDSDDQKITGGTDEAT